MTRRALFLFPSDRIGGAERVTMMIAKEAAVSGHFDRVDCYIQCWSRTGTLNKLEELGNVVLHYSGAATHLKSFFPCVRFLIHRSYDLIFSSHTHLNALVSLLRGLRLLTTKRLVSRESTPVFERDFGLVTPLIRIPYRLYGAQDLIICQTELMLNSFNNHTNGRHKDKCKVLPNPIDLDLIAVATVNTPPEMIMRIPADRTKIVWCGRIAAVKSPIRAVETLRVLHDMGHTSMHLVMIGDGPLRQDVESAITRLKLDDYVTMTGFHPTPATIMARCELGLLTSDKEGFPNVILEMLASGVLQVVTTNCSGGLAEIPSVKLSDTAEPSALANQLSSSLSEPRATGIEPYLSTRNPAEYWRLIQA